MLNPKVNYLTRDAVVDTSFSQTIVITGQSNTATAGLYKDIELKTVAQINTLFGADSHLASLLRDAYQIQKNSLIKAKIWAVSYADNGAGTARILESTVSGTSTAAGTLKVKINSLNPDRTAVQNAAIYGLRNTKGAYAGDYAKNSVELGAPSRANMGFNPLLADAFTQDVIVEVEVPSGSTAAAVAALINTVVNASTTAIYGSSVLSAVVTLTCNHKGTLGNVMSVEYLDIPAGLAISTVEDTAGSGVVTATAILDLEDSEGVKLSELDFNIITLPYGYSVAALVTDAKAKWDNVADYSNRCLEYFIVRGTAIDTSDSGDISTLASAEPIAETGIVKILFVSRLDGLYIRGVTDATQIAALEAVQFSPIQKDMKIGKITTGNTYTLSNSTGFVNVERTFAAARIREFIVELMLPADFQERSFTSGTSVNTYTYNKNDVISLFQYYRDILDGTNKNSAYAIDWQGLLDNSADARATYDEILDLSFSFDKVTGQMILNLINDLTDPIKSIYLISYYS